MARTFGPYEVVRRLAVGGSAEILLARKGGLLGFEQQFAMKLLLAQHEDDPEQRQMLVDEARLTATLDHPNIVKVHDLAEDQGVLYMVMEHVDGFNLTQLLGRLNALGRHVPIEAAVYITREVLAALHYAHTRKTPDGADLNLIHRDVSPQNVLVGLRGDVKLIDFGVAKAALGERIETKTGIIKGKLTYMAPEYATGSLQDPRSDVFAVALCLYEMLTGRAAYDIPDPVAFIAAVKHAHIDRPSKLRADIPSALESILERALERQPQDRWPTALAMEDALTEFLSTHTPNYTKERLAVWVAEVQSAVPQPDAVFSTQAGTPGPQIDPDELEALVATQSVDLDGTGPTARASGRTEWGLPAADADSTQAHKSEELLGLSDLKELRTPAPSTTRARPKNATMISSPRAIMQRDSAPSRDTVPAALAPPPGGDDDDFASADTAHIDLERPRSEQPTATNINVEVIRADVVQRVVQPGRPQIVTQSGFQAFAMRPRPAPTRQTLPGDLLEPLDPLEPDHLAETGPVDVVDPLGVTVASPSVSAEPRPAAPAHFQAPQPAPGHPAPDYRQPAYDAPQQLAPQQHAAAPVVAASHTAPGARTSASSGETGERRIPGMTPPADMPDSGILARLILIVVGVAMLAMLLYLFLF